MNALECLCMYRLFTREELDRQASSTVASSTVITHSSLATVIATVAPATSTTRSPQETSVFDFRDSDSDCEAPPVLERQRKSLTHQPPPQVITHVPITHQTLPDPPPPPVVKEVSDTFLYFIIL